MNTPKLKTVIENGYKTTLVKALISKLYPVEVNYDKLAVAGVSVTAGKLFDAILADDNVGVNTISVVGGELEIVGSLPTNHEFIGANTISVTAGTLAFVEARVDTLEQIQLSNVSVTAGALVSVIIQLNAPQEYVGPHTISVTAGTLE